MYGNPLIVGPSQIDPSRISVAECEQAAELLRDFYLRSQRAIDRSMQAHGASYARARVLLFIAREGPVRSIDLAASFNLSPRTVTETVDGLERDGLVRREPDPGDRRAKRITVTPAGTVAAEGADSARLKHVEEVFGALAATERAEFIRLLGKLNDRLGDLAAS